MSHGTVACHLDDTEDSKQQLREFLGGLGCWGITGKSLGDASLLHQEKSVCVRFALSPRSPTLAWATPLECSSQANSSARLRYRLEQKKEESQMILSRYHEGLGTATRWKWRTVDWWPRSSRRGSPSSAHGCETGGRQAPQWKEPNQTIRKRTRPQAVAWKAAYTMNMSRGPGSEQLLLSSMARGHSKVFVHRWTFTNVMSCQKKMFPTEKYQLNS